MWSAEKVPKRFQECVDGENIVFGPGDMVLTPNDTWHNHGTVGNEQALNLSVLDLPLVETLNAIHFDYDYKEERRQTRFQERADRALHHRLFADHLRLRRTLAAVCRQEVARRRPLVADVRLSLGDGARIVQQA